MPSKKQLLSFVIDAPLLERVDDFWHKYKFQSRAEAIRWLMENALDKKLAPGK
jgi:metal-responsive CopG/Arc/MetJ family transcriptional regulator